MNNQVPDFKLLWLQYKAAIISMSLLVVFYLLIRLVNLTLLPIFADEAIYIRWAQVMRSEPTLRFVPMTDGKQPLFMWVIIPFMKIFSDPLLAGRLVSVFTGLGTMLGLFFLTLQLFKSQKLALTASFIYALSPFNLFFDRMALVDSMLTMWGVWGLYFGLKLVSKPQLSWGMLSGGVIGMAWLTKSPAMAFFGLVPLTLLTNWRKLMSLKGVGKKNKSWLTPRKWYLLKLVWFWMVVGGMSFGIYNILRLGPEFHQIGLRNQDYLYPVSELLIQGSAPIRYKIFEVWQFFWKLLTPGILIATGLGIFVWFKKDFYKVLFLLVWIGGPLTLQLIFARNVTARYFLYITPAIIILAAVGVQYLFQRINNSIFKAIVAGLIFLPGLWLNYWLLTNPVKADLPRIERSGYLEEWTSGYGLREIADYLNQEAQVSSIVVGTEGFFGTTPDGLLIYFDKHPQVTIVGQSPIITEVSAQLYNSLDQNRVFLLVNDTRLEIENPELVGLRLIKAFPKAYRPDGTRESMMFFELVEDTRKSN